MKRRVIVAGHVAFIFAVFFFVSLLLLAALMPWFGWSLSSNGVALFGMKALPRSTWPHGFEYSPNGPTYSLRIGDLIWVVEVDR